MSYRYPLFTCVAFGVLAVGFLIAAAVSQWGPHGFTLPLALLFAAAMGYPIITVLRSQDERIARLEEALGKRG